MIKANKKSPPASQLPDVNPAVLTGKKKLAKKVWEFRELYMFLFLGIVTTFIFSYVTMYGLLMAFQDAKVGTIIGQAEWLGLYHFDKFFNGIWFEDVLWNTIRYSFMGQIIYPVCAIGLALLLHNCANDKLKKISQNLTYIPHLLSLVVVFVIVNLFLNHRSGLVNSLISAATGEKYVFNYYLDRDWLMFIYIISGVWMNTGNSAIIYIGALSSVDEEMVEAARVDGASKLRIIWNIQIPTILPTIITLMIMNLSNIFSVGAEKILLMQNDLNFRDTEVIGSYVYKLIGQDARYGFSTAVSIFNNVINLTMMLIINKISDKLTGIAII